MPDIASLVGRKRTVLAGAAAAAGVLFGLSGASAATVHPHHHVAPVFVHTTCHSEPASAIHGPECVCALNLHLVR